MSISIDELNNQVEILTDNYLEGLEKVSAEDIGLDPRAGSSLWISPTEVVIQDHNVNRLEYYGGFEYVSPCCKSVVGELVIYNDEDSRVADAIRVYYSKLNG